MLALVADELTDDDIRAIEQRLTKALGVAPAPWEGFLETRHGIGGSSFIRVGGSSDDGHEMSVGIRRGGAE